MKIYTKKGDKGETRLLYGDAVSKASIAPEAYGSVDELVAALGLVRCEQNLLTDAKEQILRIQRELFVLGAELATSKDNRSKLKPMETLATDSMVENLEKEIDHLTEKNGIPDFFVVPGENSISSKFDWCRVVSRRAERKCVEWKKLNKVEDTKVIIYLNRLSDLLWMLARDYEKEWTASK
jgi:cob(I)alamin adenosyltransferase